MKYAVAREDGCKPYAVTIVDWGRERTAVGWGHTKSEAEWDATGRRHPGMYVKHSRRATPADVTKVVTGVVCGSPLTSASSSPEAPTPVTTTEGQQ